MFFYTTLDNGSIASCLIPSSSLIESRFGEGAGERVRVFMRTGSGDQSELISTTVFYIWVSIENEYETILATRVNLPTLQFPLQYLISMVQDFQHGRSRMVLNYRMYDISDILKIIPKLKSPYLVTNIDLIVQLSTNMDMI